jgi:thioredoxin 2
MASVDLDDGGVIVPCNGCGQKNRLPYERLDGEVRCGKCKEAMAPPGEPIEIDQEADFERLISRSALPVVVDYWAPWCGPCRMVGPELKKVAARQAGRVLVVKINTDDLQVLGERYAIRSIPTLAVFAAGREVARTTGAKPAVEIERFIEQATAAVADGP